MHIEFTDADIARFARKTEICGHTGCLLWTASTRSGYGQFRLNSKVWSTHRLAWIFANGDIPNGLWVLHLCHNKLCVQPGHLALGTPQANTWSMVMAGRQAKRAIEPTRYNDA